MKTVRSKFPMLQLNGTPYEYSEGNSGVYGGGGGGKSTNTITKSDPWGPQQPHLMNIYDAAESEFNKGPIMSSTTPPLAPLSSQTTGGMNTLLQPGTATGWVKNAIRSGLATANDPWAGLGLQLQNESNQDATLSNRVGEGVQQAQANTTNYSAPTANVDAATRLQAILNGENDPTFQAYLRSSNQNAADQIIRNKLMPQTVDQLISGGYGGSSSQNINRAAAVDIADTIGRNNNAFTLDYVGKQLDAANLVTGAQKDASQNDINTYLAGVQGAQTEGVLDNQNRELSLRAQIGKDQLATDRARLGGELAPTYDQLQYADARRAIDVGNVYDSRAQIERDTQIAREEADKRAGWANIDAYGRAIGGSGGGAGTTTTNAPGGGTSPFAGALGGAASGAGLAAMTGGITAGSAATATAPAVAASVSPWGWAAIGAGALLGSGIL